MIRPLESAAAALALSLTIGFGAAAAQEPAKPCASTSAAESDCRGLSKSAANDFSVDPLTTGSIGTTRDAQVGVLVTPEVLNQLHRDVQLIIPDNI